jgi:hypothetical protein
MNCEKFIPKNNKTKIIKTELGNMLIEYLTDYNSFGSFSINYLASDGNTINGLIYYRNRRSRVNYMDSSVREFTKMLSLELRDLVNSNVYYNIINGEIIFQI